MELDSQLSVLLFESAEDDPAVAESAIRGGHFIVLRQIDESAGEEAGEEEPFSVVLAEIEEDIAVVCFTEEAFATSFVTEEASEYLEDGEGLPAVIMDGENLLDGLPEDCGLLVNPGSDFECYFVPGSFD